MSLRYTSRYGNSTAILDLDANTIEMNGTTYPISWTMDQAELEGIPGNPVWIRNGKIEDESITIGWEQDRESEDASDCVDDWDTPEILWIGSEEMRLDDLNSYYIVETQSGGYRQAEEIKACDLISAQRHAESMQMFQGTELVIGARVDDRGFIPDDAVLSVYSHGAWREA